MRDERERPPPAMVVKTTTMPTQVSLSRLPATHKRRFLHTLETQDPALHALLHSDEFRQLMKTLDGELIMDQDRYRELMGEQDGPTND